MSFMVYVNIFINNLVAVEDLLVGNTYALLNMLRLFCVSAGTNHRGGGGGSEENAYFVIFPL